MRNSTTIRNNIAYYSSINDADMLYMIDELYDDIEDISNEELENQIKGRVKNERENNKTICR